MGLEILRRSLGARIITIASAIVVTAFLTLFIVNSLSQKSSVLQEVKSGAERASDLVMKMIEDPMTTGNDEGTRHKFKVLADEYKDLRVFLTDFKGVSTYTTVADAEKKDLAGLYDNEDFKTLLAKSLKTKTTAGDLLKIQGDRTFTEVRSIANDPQCHHCHGASQPILGSLVIVKNIEPQLASLRNAQIRGALISFLGLAGVLFSLAMFMRKSVIHRVEAIASTTGLVSQGNLDVHFDATGEDEISNLGSHLSEMVRQIKNQIEYNRGVLSGIIVPLFVLDDQGKVTFINKAFTDILNQDAATIQGKKLSGLGEIDQATVQSVKENKSLSGLSHFQRADGVTFPLHYEIAPLKDSGDSTIGAICVMLDLTQEERDRERIEAQQANLLRVAEQVTEVALRFKEAAQILSREMDRLAEGMDNTASQTSQVAAAIEEMNASVLEIAKNAGDTADKSTESKKSAITGSQEVKEAMDVTTLVVTQADALAETLNILSQRSDNIGKVMSIINDIADQTNLLALNAAIEAARAGDAGRGFAVVADEVRKLAEKTMTATREVEAAVGQIQSGMKDAVSGMTATRGQLANALTMSGKADAELKGIVDGFIKITDMVNNIAVASEEQSAASEEISKNVGSINTLSQEISRGVQQANVKIGEVAEMSLSLVGLVANFKQVQETEKTQFHKEKRRYSRVNLAAMDHGIACYAIGAGQTEKIPAELMDISQGGVKLHFNDKRAPFSKRDSIRLISELPKGSVDLGELSGKVIWINGPEVGIEFNTPLTLTENELQSLISKK